MESDGGGGSGLMEGGNVAEGGWIDEAVDVNLI